MKIRVHCRNYGPDRGDDYHWRHDDGRPGTTAEWEALLAEFGLTGEIQLDSEGRSLWAARSHDRNKLLVTAVAVPTREFDFAKTPIRVTVVWIWDESAETRVASALFNRLITAWPDELEIVGAVTVPRASVEFDVQFESLSRMTEGGEMPPSANSRFAEPRWRERYPPLTPMPSGPSGLSLGGLFTSIRRRVVLLVGLCTIALAGLASIRPEPRESEASLPRPQPEAVMAVVSPAAVVAADAMTFRPGENGP